MSNSNSKRWWMTGISAVCLAAVTTLWAADPTTAPSATPTPTPAAAAGEAQGSARTNDPSNNDRNNRGNRNNRGRNNNNGGGNNGYRSSGGGAGTVNPNDPYGVLQVRSIFVKGNQSLIRTDPPVRPEIITRPTPQAGVPERLLVFNGVTIVNDKPEAFVEDLRSNVVVMIRVGDSIADGAVEAISFDDLSYLVRGQVRHVGLGDDFTGNAAYALMTPTTVPAAPSVPGQIVGTGASIPPVAAPTPSGLSNEDILARMKAKRAQEAQQIGK